MNGQTILNGQGHMKGGYSHEDRVMKNGSGSNSSKYRFSTLINWDAIKRDVLTLEKFNKKGPPRVKGKSLAKCRWKDEKNMKKLIFLKLSAFTIPSGLASHSFESKKKFSSIYRSEKSMTFDNFSVTQHTIAISRQCVIAYRLSSSEKSVWTIRK